jgi:hypothetical protein
VPRPPKCGGKEKARDYVRDDSRRFFPRTLETLLRRGALIAGDAGYPSDAYQTVFYLDVHDIAGGEAVEIAAVNWNAFEAMARAPGRDDEAAAGDRAGHRKSADYAGFFDVRGGTIERAVGVEKHGEEPG